MDTILKYDDEIVRLIGFDKIDDQISIIFSETGITVLPKLTRNNDTHYSSTVVNNNGLITITDTRLITMLKQFKIPKRTSYMSIGSGYMAYNLHIKDFREFLNNNIA